MIDVVGRDRALTPPKPDGAADGPPRRYVITGGPSSGKDDLVERIHVAGIPCMTEEPAREIYRKHRERLGRHLRREDRREYSLEVLEAFIAEFTLANQRDQVLQPGHPRRLRLGRLLRAQTRPRSWNRPRSAAANAIFVLDPLDTFEDPDDILRLPKPSRGA